MEPGLYFRKGNVAEIHNTRDTGERFDSCNSFVDAEMSYLVVNGWEKAARILPASKRLRVTDQSDDSQPPRPLISASQPFKTGEGRKRASGKTTAASYTRFEA